MNAAWGCEQALSTRTPEILRFRSRGLPQQYASHSPHEAILHVYQRWMTPGKSFESNQVASAYVCSIYYSISDIYFIQYFRLPTNGL